LTGQAIRYLLVGVTNTTVTLAVYALAVAAGAPPVVASLIAFSAGAVNGYRLNRSWTFRSERRGPRPLARYLAMITLGLGLNAVGVRLAVHEVDVPKLAAEIVALPPVTAVTFVLARSWVFAPDSLAGGGRRAPGAAVPRPR
jgi:putative flippase GtrA